MLKVISNFKLQTPSHNPESFMQIKSQSFPVLFVYIYTIYIFLAYRIINQNAAISFVEFVGVYKKHFNLFIRQSHKSNGIAQSIIYNV